MNTLEIHHDGNLEIATGRSRRETNWKNKETTWSDLVKKLSVTHRTAETHAEYITSKKTRQDEIKDIGGFVGGYLTGGRRKKGSVLHRQLVTLDIDFGPTDFWGDFSLMYGNAACLYSTHKHGPETPRVRLIAPLDRPVSPDEYIAIARRIAGNINIEYFADDTTFRPTQLMYWPSTSKDGMFLFEHQDGPWFCADEVLASYRDWRDSSEWPISERSNESLQRAIKKQGDPLEKPGVVGAFCRTYDIHEVIETYLSDVYEPCDIDNRYTYKEGSTTAGLVVYDDKFAYSHHGSDPTGGKLCNAFDLVRLHKFGLKDEDARIDTPINKMPSYVAMEELAASDKRVKKQRGEERLQDAKVDFTDVEEIEGEESKQGIDLSWMEELEMDRKGNYYATIDNLVLILENDQYLKGNLTYDQLEQRPVAKRNLPWRKVTFNNRYLTDRDDANLEHYLEKVYKITGTKLEKALAVIFEKHQFHPIQDYFNSLHWDGEHRIDSLLIDYMGADDSEYTRVVTRKALVAAVARVFNPGVKFEYILTLIGSQGKGKSTLLRKLGKSWFTDNFHLSMVQGKDAAELIRGVWLVEISEMAGMAKADIERIKGFVAAQVDRYRQAYGRRVENYPRQCVFFGTTNKSDFLRDQTGNRRFWPVEIGVNDVTRDLFQELTDYEVDQIWAEALHYFRKGETLYLPESLQAEAEEVQRSHTEEHPWTGLIQQYIDTKLPENWTKMNRYERIAYLHHPDELQPAGVNIRTKVCVMEIWAECLNRKDVIDDRSNSVIKGIIRNMTGWKEEKSALRYGNYGRTRGGFIRISYGTECGTECGTEVV